MPSGNEREHRHVFISYVREDADSVDKLATALERAGVEVWRDRDRIAPGARWQQVIREAIREGAFFVACFSENSAARERSYMNEELVLAIDEMRMRPTDRSWFLSVLFDPDVLPEREIGAGETLGHLQYVPLYEGWEEGVRRLVSVIEPEAYEPPPVRARRERFKRPSTVTTRGDAFVEGLLGAPVRYAADLASEILRHLQAGLPIPARLLYATDAGANDWLGLCADPRNRAHNESLQFWRGSGKELLDLVYRRIAHEDVAHLSLGCGDGSKDALLLRDWLRQGADVTYYPYDISPVLIQHALNRVLDGAPLSASRRLQAKAIIADFEQVEMMGNLLSERPGSTVVTLLGGSFGSLELALLRKLKTMMSDDDLLVLEVPLAIGAGGSLEPNDLRWRQFYFRPLEVLGLQFDEMRMTVTTTEGISQIPDATTDVISYGDIQISGRRYSEVQLGHITHYTEQGLLRTVEIAGFEILEHRTAGQSEDFVVCVARRSTSG
ncbi:MAG TPA: L-histidine N(alpha)-methyltransferase [Solirubrobacteraceae bacterium]